MKKEDWKYVLQVSLLRQDYFVSNQKYESRLDYACFATGNLAIIIIGAHRIRLTRDNAGERESVKLLVAWAFWIHSFFPLSADAE